MLQLCHVYRSARHDEHLDRYLPELEEAWLLRGYPERPPATCDPYLNLCSDHLLPGQAYFSVAKTLDEHQSNRGLDIGTGQTR